MGSPNSDEEHGRSLRRDPDVAKSACDGENEDCISDPPVALEEKILRKLSETVVSEWMQWRSCLLDKSTVCR